MASSSNSDNFAVQVREAIAAIEITSSEENAVFIWARELLGPRRLFPPDPFDGFDEDSGDTEDQ